jgi:hypothetical protein
MRKIPLVLLALFIYGFALAKSEINLESIKQKYAKYNAVVTKREYLYVFDIVKDTLQVIQHNSKEILILNEHPKAYTNDVIYYGSFSTIKNLKASTLLPNGKGYKKIAVTQFNESHDTDGSIFFDDSKAIQFAYPSLTQGAITTLNYSVVFKNPRFINNSYLQSFIPTIGCKVIVKTHKDIKLGYKLLNGEGYKINFKQYTKGKYNYWEWEVTDLAPFKYLGAPHFSITHYSPHIALFVEKYKVKGKEHTFFGTVDNLFQYYQKYLSQMDNSSSNELEEMVNKLTAGLNEREKAKAIYYWVQNNIKYVAYVQGDMGFIPASPTEVFTKRFGDCKGMSSLINKMMELAGLPARLSWVGTRKIPYTYNNMPLPSVDNHMVTSYLKGDSVIIMDGTFKFLDFGLYPYHIQGKEVLISISEKEYKLFEVPISPSSTSVVTDSVSISIVGNAIKGKALRTHTGFHKMELANAMDGVKKEDYSKRFSALFGKGNNKFKVDSFRVGNLFEYDKPAEVYYEFSLADYTSSMGDEIYINLNLDKSPWLNKVDTTSQYSPISNDFYFTEKHITRFQIPEGYRVTFIPGDDHFEHENFKYSLKYKQEDNSIVLEKVIVGEFLLLLDNKFNDWNKMLEQLTKNYRLSLVLKKV